MNTEFGRKTLGAAELKNTLQPGMRLQNGKYVIIEVYGQGPFTISYLARQTILGKKAVINEFFLLQHCSRSAAGEVINETIDKEIYQTFRDRWLEEAMLLSKCSGNEHFVTVLDAFQENGTAYYVTEYINEEDLRTYTLSKKEKHLDEAAAIDLIEQISSGLSFLHRNQIHHLNLSPIKILIDKGGKAVIFSVGIARKKIPTEVVPDFTILTKAGYSAPELYQRESEGGVLSDMYSVGAIFYFILTGHDPLPAPDRLQKTMTEPKSVIPGLSTRTNSVVLKAMAMKPEDRYQDLDELIKDLKPVHRKPHPVGTRKAVLYAALAVVLVTFGGFLGFELIRGKKPIKEITGFIYEKKMNHKEKLAQFSLNQDKMRGMTMIRDTKAKDSVIVGTYYALLIGIENYKDSHYQKLSQPVKDVNSVYEVLTTYYTFEKSNVQVLTNPEKKAIFKVLNDYRDNLTQYDNLFVFYAGHGWYDERANMGYLIPSDADSKNDADWISFQDIRKKFEVIPARHVLLIADACYAGSVFRGGESDPEDNMDQMTLEQLSKRSRTAFTSAFLKPVPDKSDFLKHLINCLKSNPSQFLLSEDLYIDTRNSLMRSTSKKDPVKWGVLQDCGDEGGDFILIRRSK